MGEARRRMVIDGGAGGRAASDPVERAACLAVVNRLLPQVEGIAAEVGWAPVLNGLATLVINLYLENLGPARTEASLRQMLRDLPKAQAAIRTIEGGMASPTGRA